MASETERMRLSEIEYHGRRLTSTSSEPADQSVTTRVLTIMLAEEC